MKNIDYATLKIKFGNRKANMYQNNAINLCNSRSVRIITDNIWNIESVNSEKNIYYF